MSDARLHPDDRALLERAVIALEALARLQQAQVRRTATEALEAAWRAEIGPAPMSTAAVMAMAAEYPHGDLAAALASVVNMDAPGAAVSLGKLLAAVPWLESERRGGVLLYRLRGD